MDLRALVESGVDSGIETKNRVRTLAGARRFRRPIGAMIGVGFHTPGKIPYKPQLRDSFQNHLPGGPRQNPTSKEFADRHGFTIDKGQIKVHNPSMAFWTLNNMANRPDVKGTVFETVYRTAIARLPKPPQSRKLK